jgi:RNA polymerase sigma factor (TIGR02999 family)
MRGVSARPSEVTGLLRAWEGGDAEALEKLSSLVHAELRRLARRYLAGERQGMTLQPTALINEAWMRLIDWRNAGWKNRAHFFAVSATMMRRILVDYARRRPHIERPGDAKHVAIEGALEVSPQRSRDLVALDDALQSLTALDPRKGRVVELRFFGGLTEEETAEALGISVNTVQREWSKARAWLYRYLSHTDDSGR